MMPPKTSAHLPQLFRGPFLRKIASGTYYNELVERLSHAGLNEFLDCTLSEIFTQVYSQLLKSYRCEYVYKNALTHAWFNEGVEFGKSYVTDEFRVGKCRVDLAIFSKKSFAFEIKSEFDSTVRLPSQTDTYAKVFDRVYVVTSVRMKEKVMASVPEDVGIMLLLSSGELKSLRESASYAQQTNLGVAFDCLRQAEMLSIAKKIGTIDSEMPSSRIYSECRSKFRTLLPFEANKLISQQFRNRGYASASDTLMKDVPAALKHAALTLRASNEEMYRLREELSQKPKPYRSPPIINRQSTNYEHLLPILERKAKRNACSPACS